VSRLPRRHHRQQREHQSLFGGSGVSIIRSANVAGTRVPVRVEQTGQLGPVVAAPSGVFVIDTKAYRGRVELIDRGSFLRPSPRLHVDGWDRSDLVASSARGSCSAAEAAGHGVDPVEVMAVLCFVGSRWAMPASHVGVGAGSSPSSKRVLASHGLDSAIDAAGGYPYFIQAIGKQVWDHARVTPISLEDVQVGLAEARREVDDGLYRSRWERATPAQRDLLRALAELGGEGPATVADIAKAMGKARGSDISVARTELIRKGLTYPPERGLLAFTVPGMHEFILRQA